MLFKSLALAATLLFSSVVVHADEALIRKTLTAKFPGVQIVSVAKTPYSGLYEVFMDGQLFYADDKAKFVIMGNVLDVATRTNLTKERLGVLTAISWDKLPLGNAIKTVKGNGKREIVVFSDVDCPYCRRFEGELAKVDNITTYTFLFPIASLHPKSLQVSRQIWCAPNKNKAWDDYLGSGKVPDNDGKCTNPVDDNIALGHKYDVEGTPTIFLRNGQRESGAVPAERLEQLMADAAKPAAKK
jgi:thiol:disulfide interchange protein DsbC